MVGYPAGVLPTALVGPLVGKYVRCGGEESPGAAVCCWLSWPSAPRGGRRDEEEPVDPAGRSHGAGTGMVVVFIRGRFGVLGGWSAASPSGGVDSS
ncbi:MAG TPA: hypothetical protein PK777_02085 [Thermoguttaceae bacterium]|nr:hypothetical protein [Thermoguttaceae bacterium]